MGWCVNSSVVFSRVFSFLKTIPSEDISVTNEKKFDVEGSRKLALFTRPPERRSSKHVCSFHSSSRLQRASDL